MARLLVLVLCAGACASRPLDLPATAAPVDLALLDPDARDLAASTDADLGRPDLGLRDLAVSAPPPDLRPPDCDGGTSLCNDACVDETSDPHDCGACGHDCRGGACVGGACQPVTMLGDLPNLAFVAVDASDIYWTNFIAITKMPLGGGAPITLASVSGAEGIAVTRDSVYCATYEGDTVVRVPIGGGAATTLLSGMDTPFGIAIAGDSLYVTSYWKDLVMQLPIGGGAPTALTTAQGTGGGATGLAISGGQIYWGQGNSTLDVLPIGGGASTAIVSNQSDPMGVATDDTYVYWTNFYGGAVMRRPLAGGAVTTLISGLTVYALGIAVDNDNIYWATRDNNNVGALMRLAK